MTTQTTESTESDKQFIPVIIENPCLVKKITRINKYMVFTTFLMLFNILLSILFLSMIYGNQSQMFRSANQHQVMGDARTTEICSRTAEVVADKVENQLKIQSKQEETEIEKIVEHKQDKVNKAVKK